VYSAVPEGPDDGSGGRYAGALHHLVGVENLFRAVAALLEGDVPLPELFLIFTVYCALVGQKYVKSLDLGQDSRPDAAFASTQNYNPFHIVLLLNFQSLSVFVIFPYRNPAT